MPTTGSETRPTLPGLPARYTLERRLGGGGGGQVWAARDRGTGLGVAVKVLHLDASTHEADALIREATALGGLEGLGFPRVLRFGRLLDGRLFLVRELIEGQSLDQLDDDEGARMLGLICLTADALTVVHRAGLLHGDVKPANVIVRPDGGVALVDLGLAAALRERGSESRGLTPHYAAPELERSGALTPQAEVYSLGVMLRDALLDIGDLGPQDRGIEAVCVRAQKGDPGERFPSTDEFAAALRAALSGDAPRAETVAAWPIVEVEALAKELAHDIERLAPGARFELVGPLGAGVSTLLRRVSWGLSVAGRPVGFVSPGVDEHALALEEIELSKVPGGVLFVDGALGALEGAVSDAARAGARVVVGRHVGSEAGADGTVETRHVPPLGEAGAARLLAAALPALGRDLVGPLLERTGGRPGALREFVLLARDQPVASVEDLDAILRGVNVGGGDALELVEVWLDRGHFARVREQLGALPKGDPRALWFEARYEIAAGSAARAKELAERALALDPPRALREHLTAALARAELGLGLYREAVLRLEPSADFLPEPRLESAAYAALAETLLGKHDAALARITSAEEALFEADVRLRFWALLDSVRATAEWRSGNTSKAMLSYEKAARRAALAGDAGLSSSALVNLAALQKERGDLANAVRTLESAADAARRSGRKASLSQVTLNLANLDLYLGRVERARAGIAGLDPAEALAPALAAQQRGLVAELASRSGDVSAALLAYEACAHEFEQLGRTSDAAEALFEAVLLSTAREPISGADRALAAEWLERGRVLLGSSESALLRLSEARLSLSMGDEAAAARHLEAAETRSRETHHRESLWRVLALAAELATRQGKPTRAERHRREAVEVLEEIGSNLPDDLRTVFWNEPRRRALRTVTQSVPYSFPYGMSGSGGVGSSQAAFETSRAPRSALSRARAQRTGSDALSRVSQTPLERRLSQILAINAELAREVDLARLTEKIVAHAAELLGAERAFLLLGETADALRVLASRGGQGADHESFSRSVAERVLQSGEPLVSIDAERDQRLSAFESVHAALVTAIACIPIVAPNGRAVGALYLEARGGVRPDFGAELPTLQAFADQAAIALEHARLVAALAEQSRSLAEQNAHLEETKDRLRQVLERRSERLREARRELRETRSQMRGAGSYQGLVGSSEAMRRIYALIERIKDTDVPVLVTGESGTGKEMVARAIFQGSARARGPMLAINCGAIPESILESELFGHVKGAFTGADRDRKGVFREASGGLLFLDEIGETPLKMQAGLLRVLQEHRVRPVGASDEVPVDVRLVFATNRNLEDAVLAGKFREDLLYRIRVVEIALPPLRERPEDIPLLCDHFLERMAARFDQSKKALSREAMQLLCRHPLPGNVRQLENLLLNAWVMCEGERIEVEDIPLVAASSLHSSDAPLPARESRAGSAPPRVWTGRPGSRPHAVSGGSSPLRGSAPPMSASFSERPLVERATERPSERPIERLAAQPFGSSSDSGPRAARESARGVGVGAGAHEERGRSERARILWALEQTGWNRVRAAALIGMPRRTFYRRLKDFGLQ